MPGEPTVRVLLPTFDSLATLAGGVEQYVHHLALALEAEGHEVRVLARRPARNARVPAGPQYDWVPLPALPASHRTRLFMEGAFARGVRKAARWADVVVGDYNHWFETYASQWRDVVMPISAKELLMAGVTTDRGGPVLDRRPRAGLLQDSLRQAH